MSGSRFPHSLALIMAMIVAAQLLGYVLPAGRYAVDVETEEVKEDARTLTLPAGSKALVPDELVLLLPGGGSIDLPGGLSVACGDAPPITLPEQRTLQADGLRYEATVEELKIGGETYQLPRDGVLRLPQAVVRPRGSSQLLVFQGEAIELPEGTQRVTPSRKIKPGTYAQVDADPLPWHASLSRVSTGLEAAADIIFFVFLVGGVIAVLRATGAIDALIALAIRALGGNPLLLVGGMMTVFAVGSSTIGMAEEYMPFIPVLVAMCLALKLDAMVALGIVYVGAGVGYGCAAINPFTVAIAKDIAGEPLLQGAGARWALLAVLLAVGTHHVLRYARRVAADPSRSLVGDVDYSSGYDMPEDTAMTGRRVAILTVFAAGIALFVYGVSEWEWFLKELATVFLATGLLAAVIGRLSPNKVCERFCSGAAELTTTALLIGFARTIQVIFDEAAVTHTIIDGIAAGLDQLGPQLAALGMLVVQSVCNLLIPSGSGQAYVTMPIMAPIADLTGVGRETAVFAYQFGDGFTNMIVPTNALLMGMLGLGKVPYQRWLRFILPLMLKIYIVAAVFLWFSVDWFAAPQ